MRGSSFLVTLGSVQRRRGSSSSSFVRQIVYKLKGQWKQDLGWERRRSPRFSYDHQSYSLNFDDGTSYDIYN
ncbi:hypothetical protein G2W53_023922 [Senna tora]|uniref:Uncharacterized protein n=1 Tax=Senna tora TaxID=362788 RepID=A0A834WDD9_9FABA|nr:hypothetical protein G2W53_023922 [Senna tora]